MNTRPTLLQSPMPDWLRRLTRFWFGLIAITDLVSGATVVPNASIAQELNLDTSAGYARCWNAGVPPELSAAFLAALEK